MQPIPQSNTRQNKRARKLHSSRPSHLERSRVSSQGSTGWSPQHILRWKKTTHRLINQTVNLEEDTQRCHFAPVPKIREQHFSTGSINAQKHLATTVTSRKTLIVFLKMPTLIEAEAAIALTCFSNVNLESRMTPKIFNSETISTTEPLINRSGNKGSTVRERDISILLVLLGFTNMPHLLHQSLIIAKSSFNDAATDDLSRGCGILQSKVESSA